MASNEIFFQKTIAASGSFTSNFVLLRDGKTTHALELKIAGDGTISISVSTSISGKNYYNNGTKATGLTKTSGPDSDGVVNLPLHLNPGDFFKVTTTETGTSDEVVVDAYFSQK